MIDKNFVVVVVPFFIVVVVVVGVVVVAPSESGHGRKNHCLLPNPDMSSCRLHTLVCPPPPPHYGSSLFQEHVGMSI